jgi:hypothetical protein
MNDVPPTRDPLFDGGPHDDPFAAHLEDLLGPLRYRRPAPQVRPQRRWLAAPLAAAAVLLLLLGWQATQGPSPDAKGDGWAFTIERSGEESRGKLRPGGWLETGADEQARVVVAGIGHIELGPRSRMQLRATRDVEHRIRLDLGRMAAQIDAPPRVFITETPAGEAVDLGCAYTLVVDPKGRGMLHVTSGWVALEGKGRQSLVPVDGRCEARRGFGPGTPHFETASPALRFSLQRLDFGSGGATALRVVLEEARLRDTLTLWHLLGDLRRSPAERGRVLDRIEALQELPVEFTRAGLLDEDDAERQRLYDVLSLHW